MRSPRFLRRTLPRCARLHLPFRGGPGLVLILPLGLFRCFPLGLFCSLPRSPLLRLSPAALLDLNSYLLGGVGAIRAKGYPSETGHPRDVLLGDVSERPLCSEDKARLSPIE